MVIAIIDIIFTIFGSQVPGQYAGESGEPAALPPA